MGRDRPSDRAAALALAALAAGLAIAHLALPALEADPPSTLRSVLRTLPRAWPALILALAALVVRRVLVARALRDRDRLEVRPSEDHDPTREQVRQLAAALARPHRAGRPRAARGVRIEITPDADGTVHYLLSGPAGSRPALHAALTAYPDVELHDPPPTLKSAGRELRVVRCELVLARPAHEPLADADQLADLHGPIATAMSRLNADGGEHATVALDVQIASAGRARRLRRRMARRAHPPVRLNAATGDNDAHGRASTPATVERRHDTRGLARKLDPAEVLVEFQLLLAVQGRERDRAVSVMRSLLAAFDAMAADNHLRVSGLRLGGLGFLGSDSLWRRPGFDRRLRAAHFAPRRRNIVTASEVAGLLTPPTVDCAADNIARSLGAIPQPPRGLPTYPSSDGEVIPLGRVRDRTGERIVGVRAVQTFFSYHAGRSRYGKTETAIGQFVALALTGYGGLFIDPHADAIAEIKAYLTDPDTAGRVVEIDASDRATRQPAWNLFAVPTRTPQEAAGRVEAFVDALATTLGWDDRNTRALNLATQAATALTQLALTAGDPALAPTVFQVPTLLSDETWRAAALPHLDAGTREFFEQRFPRLPAEAITAVTNLIDRLHAAQPVAALLGRPVSTFDAARALRENLIVLACPGPGSTRDRLLANLLVYDVLHACRTRAAMPVSERRPFWVFLDELQTYDGPNLPALLEQSAKYGGRAFLFNQNPERLTPATWNAVSTNRSHLASTTVNARAARMIAAEWGTKPGPDVLTRLERYTYLASVTHGAQITRPFLVHGIPAAELHRAHHHPDRVGALEQTIDHTAGRTPTDQALAEAGAHDQRLRDWLTAPADRERQGSGTRTLDLRSSIGSEERNPR